MWVYYNQISVVIYEILYHDEWDKIIFVLTKEFLKKYVWIEKIKVARHLKAFKLKFTFVYLWIYNSVTLNLLAYRYLDRFILIILILMIRY